MPNPIAHPAASIPFTKVGLVFSALVVGSLSPDFGYFIPLPGYFFMYTLPGLMLFDLPAGFILLWIFHTLMKWPLLALLPFSLQRRLFNQAQGFSFGPPKRFFLILISLLVGSITHVILDSFTHDYGWMVEQFSLFRVSIGGVPFYTVLQNLGSVLGIGIMIYWFLRWLSATSQSEQPLPRFPGKFETIFLALAMVSLASVEGRIIYLRLSTGSRFTGHHFLMFGTIFSAIFIVSLFIGIYCLTWMLIFYKTIRPADHSG